MTGKQVKVALVSSPYLGWGTIRKRWEKAFSEDPDFDFMPIHWEEKARPWRRVYERTGRLQSLWFGLAGRQACLEAYRAGYRRILLTTIAQAGLLPKQPDARYFVYGDSTPKQLHELYGKRPSPGLEQLAYHALRETGENVHFLCMSRWFQKGLCDEYGIPEGRTSILPPAIDTDLWAPPTGDSRGRAIVLFVGGDFKRKGGPLLREVAATMVHEANFIYVTKVAHERGPNETFRTDLRADSPELIAVMRGATVLALPSLADCSPNVAIEAAATGVPVVASPVGGVPEVVLDGLTGTIVREHASGAYANAIRTYLSDPGLCELHGTNGRRNVLKNHSLVVQLKRLKQMMGI